MESHLKKPTKLIGKSFEPIGINEKRDAEFAQKYLVPLIEEDGKKIDILQAMKNMRNVNFMTYCGAANSVLSMEECLTKRMEEIGYNEQEIEKILSQMCFVGYGTSVIWDEEKMQKKHIKSTHFNFGDIFDKDVKVNEYYKDLVQEENTLYEDGYYFHAGTGNHDIVSYLVENDYLSLGIASVLTRAMSNSILNHRSNNFVPITRETLSQDLKEIISQIKQERTREEITPLIDRNIDYGAEREYAAPKLVQQLAELAINSYSQQQDLRGKIDGLRDGLLQKEILKFNLKNETAKFNSATGILSELILKHQGNSEYLQNIIKEIIGQTKQERKKEEITPLIDENISYDAEQKNNQVKKEEERGTMESKKQKSGDDNLTVDEVMEKRKSKPDEYKQVIINESPELVQQLTELVISSYSQQQDLRSKIKGLRDGLLQKEILKSSLQDEKIRFDSATGVLSDFILKHQANSEYIQSIINQMPFMNRAAFINEAVLCMVSDKAFYEHVDMTNALDVFERSIEKEVRERLKTTSFENLCQELYMDAGTISHPAGVRAIVPKYDCINFALYRLDEELGKGIFSEQLDRALFGRKDLKIYEFDRNIYEEHPPLNLKQALKNNRVRKEWIMDTYWAQRIIPEDRERLGISDFPELENNEFDYSDSIDSSEIDELFSGMKSLKELFSENEIGKSTALKPINQKNAAYERQMKDVRKLMERESTKKGNQGVEDQK